MNYSRQREEVLDQIRGHKDHPTADTIFAELRTKDPSISLATVYRNLKLLSDRGEIRRLTMKVAEALDAEAEEFVPGVVTGHDLVFYGVCDSCRAVEGSMEENTRRLNNFL